MIESAYVEWFHATMRRMGGGAQQPSMLFGSMVDEPTHLVREVMAELFADGASSRYVNIMLGGNPFLIDAIAARYGIPASQIVTTPGATYGIDLICRTCIQPGDEILVETPGFDVLAEAGRASGATIRTFSRSCPDYAVPMDEVADKITDRTRLIILTDLHNPSGFGLTRQEIETLSDLAAAYGAHLLVDEVYHDFTADGVAQSSAAGIADNIIATNSLTKFHGLSTLRCGWIVSASSILDSVRQHGRTLGSGSSKLAHAMGAHVLENPGKFDDYTRAAVREGRSIFEPFHTAWRDDGLIEGALPDHGCFCFPRMVGVEDTIAFSDWLIRAHDLVVAPGEHFGKAGHVRMGFASPPERLCRSLELFDAGLREYRSRRR